MFDVKNDRHLLTELLSPPVGYAFDRAVATTYSLDLMALLSVPLKLLRGEEATLDKDPIRLLQALREQGRRLRVYHQYGNVLPVAKAHPLLCWLEEVTVAVRPPEKGAFHPKIWIIRFRERDGSGIKFRFVTGSRNLTFDRSADVVVSFDGDVTKKPNKKVRPLVDFLTYLNDYGDIDEDGSFLRQLRHTTFRGGAPFDYFGLHFSGHDGKSPSWWNKIRAERAIVLSPFLSKMVVKHLSEVCGEVILVSRRLALQKIGQLPQNFTAYHFKDSFIDRDQLQEFGPEDTDVSLTSTAPASALPTPTDLHAKVFSFEQEQRCYTFLGSGNATRNATRGTNVEAMIELRSKPADFGPTSIARDLLLGETSSLFEQYVAGGEPENTDKEEAQKLIEDAMRDALNSLEERTPTGIVKAREGLYDIHMQLNLRRMPPAYQTLQLSVWSLFDEAHPETLRSGSVTSYVAQSLRTEQLSRWLVVKVNTADNKTQLTRLIKVNLTGIPAERDARVITSILQDEQRFFEYLILLLTDDYIAPNAEDNEEAESWAFFNAVSGNATPPLFERLARQLALHPHTLEHIGDLMETLATEREGVVSDRFRQLWSVFSSFLPKEQSDE